MWVSPVLVIVCGLFGGGLVGCGASTSPSSTQPLSTPTSPSPPQPAARRADAVTAEAANVASVPDESSAERKIVRVATVAIDQVLVDGPRSLGEVQARLEAARGGFARCGTTIEASRVVELAFAITDAGEIPHVGAHGDAPPEVVSCLAGALGSLETRVASNAEPTDVYVMIALELDGVTASRPSRPDLRADGEAACSMFARSGAAKLRYDANPHPHEVARAWFRANVRHPVVLHHMWHIANSNPADLARVSKQLRVKTKAKRCDDAGW